jgi:hypothetical protein
MRHVVLAAVLLFAGASTAGAAPPAQGNAVIGGVKVQLRYAAAFVRSAPNGTGGYAIVLAEKPIRCDQLSRLPTENRLGERWALIALYPTKDGSLPTSNVRGEIDYPVADAYAALARGVSISVRSWAPIPGAVWQGRAYQAPRKVEGLLYSLKVRFSARWCG